MRDIESQCISHGNFNLRQQRHRSITGGTVCCTTGFSYLPDGLVYAGLVAYKYKGEMPADYEIEWKEGTSGGADDAFNGCSNKIDN